MNLVCWVQDQLNTSEPTASYIIGRELNLRKLPGQQWESNPQLSEQLRPMTIKTSASTETATTPYILVPVAVADQVALPECRYRRFRLKADHLFDRLSNPADIWLLIRCSAGVTPA